jgi:predicted AlkP superfamily phosphohydrolase/phosphomutase
LLHRLLRVVAPADVTRKLRDKFGAAARLDWSRTRAIVLPTDRNSYVRINVRGREPQGVVEPGQAYEATLQMIEREFRALVNDETSNPAVEEVFRVQELYPGPRAIDLPDLAILWSSEAPINVIRSPRLGRVEMRRTERRSGNHRPEGFLFARGPAFKSGQAELRGDILQIAPTLLSLYDVPCPDAFAMGPLTELFVERIPRAQ